MRREEIALIYLLSHAGEQQPIHSLQSGDGSLLLLVVQALGEKEGEEEGGGGEGRGGEGRGGEGRGGGEAGELKHV